MFQNMPTLLCVLVAACQLPFCANAFAGGPDFPTTKIEFEHEFLPDGLQNGDRFGETIVLSDDYLVFGAPGVDIDGLSNTGRVYVYDAHTNQLLYELQSPAPGDGDEFGAAVAIDGDLIAIGARNDDQLVNDGGAVFLFDAAMGALVDTLLPESPEEFDRFGFSVAVSGSYICIGLGNDNEAGTNVGSVEVFDRTTHTRLGKLLPDDPTGVNAFGVRAVIIDHTLAISAFPSDIGGVNTGAVFVFDLSTMTQRYFVQGSDTMDRDEFGSTIAVTSDRLFVGTELNDALGDRSGSVYAFDLNSGQELFKFEIPDPMPNDRFGSALAADDEYVVVGAKRSAIDETNGGAVYLFRASDGRLLSRLVTNQIGSGDQIGTGAAIYNGRVLTSGLRQPSSGITSGYVYSFSLGLRVFENSMLFPCNLFNQTDGFGGAMVIDGDTLVIGASRDSYCGINFGNDIGVAYVIDLSTMSVLHTLAPSGPIGLRSFDRFGYDVAISEDYIAVSAPRATGSNDDSGAVYIFDRGTGALLRKLIPESGTQITYFGSSIDIDGGIIAVGAQYLSLPGDFDRGGVYTFDIDTGELIALCIAEDGDQNDQLGISVDLQGGVVLAGAPFARNVTPAPGAAYLFDAFSGEQLMKIYDPDIPVSQVHFGEKVVLDGDRMIISAPNFTLPGEPQSGKVHVFDASTGLRTDEIISTQPYGLAHFGRDLAVDGDRLLIGMNQNSTILDFPSPSATLYDLNEKSLISELLPTRGDIYARFGYGVALSSDFAFVGMTPQFGDLVPHHSSAVFVYHMGSSSCPADLNADSSLDFFDVSAFLVAYTTDDLSIADFNDDGSLDFFDVSAFLVAFKAGCP